MLNIYLWNELVVIPFITPEIVAANRSAWVTLFGGNSLGWVKPTESIDGIDLLDQSTGFNYSCFLEELKFREGKCFLLTH